MYCMNCNKELKECNCRSDEDLRMLTDVVATKWCRTCDKHYSRCDCITPVWNVLYKGQYYPMSKG